MKKLSLIVMLGVLVASTFACVGVSQEDYDQVVSDLSAAQAEVTKLEGELSAAEDQASSLQDELDSLNSGIEDFQSEADSLQTECENLQSEYEALDAEVVQYQENLELSYVYQTIVVELLGPAITGDTLTDASTIDAIGDLVEQTGDAELQTKYDAWAQAPSNKELAAEVIIQALLEIEKLIYE